MSFISRATARLDAASPRDCAALCVCAIGFLLLPVALLRFVDGDEGFYIYAVRLIREGRMPYRDFFYTQAPLLPYALAIGNPSWLSQRLLSFFAAALIGLLLIWRVANSSLNARQTAVAATLFGASCLVFTWFTVVKTYSLATLLLFAACLVGEPHGRQASTFRLAAAGVLLGLAAGVRSIFIVALLGFMVHAFLAPKGRRASGAAWILLGTSIGLAPTAYFAWAAPSNFLFGNFDYHMIRPAAADLDPLGQKLGAAARLFGFGFADFSSGFQFSALFAVNVWALVCAHRSRRQPSLSLAVAPFLFAAHWLPTPSYPQYFCVLVPFMILNAVTFLGGKEVFNIGGKDAVPNRLRRAAYAALAVYAILAPIDLYRCLHGGRGMPPLGDASDAQYWRIGSIESVGRKIDALLPGDAPVLVFWPGYLVGSRHPPLHGMENQFGLEIASQLSPEDLQARQIVSREDVEAAIRARTVPLAVLGNWVGDWRSSMKEPMAQLLRESGYKQVFYGWGAGFYMRTEDALGKDETAGSADSGVK